MCEKKPQLCHHVVLLVLVHSIEDENVSSHVVNSPPRGFFPLLQTKIHCHSIHVGRLSSDLLLFLAEMNQFSLSFALPLFRM